MHLQIDLNYILNDLLRVIIPILIGYVVVFLKKHIHINIKGKYATMAVHYAEVLYKDLDGKDKYNKALDWFTGQLKKYGIKMSEDEVRGWLEFAYAQFKKDLNSPTSTTEKAK